MSSEPKKPTVSSQTCCTDIIRKIDEHDKHLASQSTGDKAVTQSLDEMLDSSLHSNDEAEEILNGLGEKEGE